MVAVDILRGQQEKKKKGTGEREREEKNERRLSQIERRRFFFGLREKKMARAFQEALQATIEGSTHDAIQKPHHRGILTKFDRVQVYNKRLRALQTHTQVPLVPIPTHHSVVNPSEIPELELQQGKLKGTVHRRLDDTTEIVFTLQELTTTY